MQSRQVPGSPFCPSFPAAICRFFHELRQKRGYPKSALTFPQRSHIIGRHPSSRAGRRVAIKFLSPCRPEPDAAETPEFLSIQPLQKPRASMLSTHFSRVSKNPLFFAYSSQRGPASLRRKDMHFSRKLILFAAFMVGLGFVGSGEVRAAALVESVAITSPDSGALLGIDGTYQVRVVVEGLPGADPRPPDRHLPGWRRTATDPVHLHSICGRRGDSNCRHRPLRTSIWLSELHRWSRQPLWKRLAFLKRWGLTPTLGWW